jgi:hypothetical protein
VVGTGEQISDSRALPRLPLRSGYHAAPLRRRELTTQQYDKDFQ